MRAAPNATKPRGGSTPKFRLREYQLADFDALLALDRECFVEGIAYSEQDLSRFLHRRGASTIVAEEAAGAIAGFVIAQVQRNLGWIVTIDIRAGARRSGLGTLLMADAEKRLREAEVTAILLEVAVDNLPAIKFYKRLGYDIARTLPRYYLDSLDAFQMVKQF